MLEIEAKFLVPDSSTYRTLQAVRQLKPYTVQKGTMQTVQDTYWDTEDRRIMRAGYACRIRQIGEEYTVTLKSLEPAQSATHRREELEASLPGPVPPQQWPAGPVQEQVLTFIQAAPLEMLFQLRQQRHKRHIQQETRLVAEFSLDTVELTHGARRQSYTELEIELQPAGTEADLAAIIAVLQATYRLQPQRASKFERGLRFVAAAAADDDPDGPTPTGSGLTPDDTMTAAAQKTLRLHFQRMLAHEAGTRLGADIEELHDMRVATRRMRAACRIYRDYLDMAALAPHLKRLRRAGQRLGAVRDLDVYHAKLTAYLAAQPPDTAPDLTPLWQAWELAHHQAHTALEAYLDGAAYAKFKAEFAEWLAQPLPEPRQMRAAGDIIPHRLRHLAPEIIYRRLGEVRAYDEWLHGPDIPLERYHQLRIAIKYLRYTLEFFRDILGSEIGAPIEQLKSLQDYLGDLHDAVVANRQLCNFWAWGTLTAPPGTPPTPPPAPRIVAPGVALYHASRRQEIQERVAQFPGLWQQFQTSDFVAQIAKAISIL